MKRTAFYRSQNGFIRRLLIEGAIEDATPGTIIVIPDGIFQQDGPFILNKPGITIRLSDGTIIQNESPCFTVNANNVTITSETIGGGIDHLRSRELGQEVEHGAGEHVAAGYRLVLEDAVVEEKDGAAFVDAQQG